MFGPHETNLGRDRALTERHTAYYARRALGGAGIIVVEEASVHDSDWPYERAPLAERCASGWNAIGEACVAHGAVVLAGLGHAGGQGTSHWNQHVMWAPSPVPEVATREVPKVLEQHEIDAVIAGFAAATTAAVGAGLHGVEINAGQFSLIRQFLSALTNMRGDGYGADRSRFARDVLKAVRAAAGDAVVGLRLSCDEMAPWAGLVPEAAATLATELAPFVDMITVVRGSIYTAWATRPDQHESAGFGIELARVIRTAVRESGSTIPVVAQGSIVEWAQAEWAIDSGAADAVEMTRAQLADAELVRKLRTNSSARIRPCLLCNQTCKVRDNRNPIVTCIVDPRTGHETEDPAEPAPATPSRRPLTIIGAGLAGLEAARWCAMRGGNVRVLEASERAGGIVRTAAVGAGRDRLAGIADWLVSECGVLGVHIETNHAVSNAELTTLHASGPVIVATGSTTGLLPFAIFDGAVVLDAAELLVRLRPHQAIAAPAEGAEVAERGQSRSLGSAGADHNHADDDDRALPAGPIAVWDPIGGPIGISIAERLAAGGHDVTLLTPDLLIGEKLALTGDLAPAQVRLHGAAITLVKRAIVRSVREGSIEIEDRFSGETSVIEAAALIACGHRLPDTTLDPGEDFVHAGDRIAPRTIHEAILEGRRAAIAVART